MLEYAAARRKGNVEMKRIMLVAACLACGVTSFIAVASASAALPSLFECESVGTGKGKFAKGCTTEKARGGFEVIEGVSKERTFKAKGGAGTFHLLGSGEFTCSSGNAEGKIASGKVLKKVIVTFEGCSELGVKCHTEGQIFGTIETLPLEGTLGYINKGNGEVGLDVKGEAGATMAEYTCRTSEIWKGSLIGEMRGVNAFAKDFTLSWVVEGGGRQSNRNLEGEPTDVIEAFVNGSGPFEFGVQEQMTLSTGNTSFNIKA
jgi:hypothetical protein